MPQTMIEVQCAWCGKKTRKELRRVNGNKKRGSRMYCNNSCRGKSTHAKLYGVGETKVMFQCEVCGKASEKTLANWNTSARRGCVQCCGKSCSGKVPHGKRYKGEIMMPRIIPNKLR